MTAPVLFLSIDPSARTTQQLCSASLRKLDKRSGLALSQPRQYLLKHTHAFVSRFYVIILLCMSEAWLKWR